MEASSWLHISRMSSANCRVRTDGRTVHVSFFTYSANKVGPNTAPCGTPQNRWVVDDLSMPNTTRCRRSVRQLLNHSNGTPTIPILCRSEIRTSCLTLSIASAEIYESACTRLPWYPRALCLLQLFCTKISFWQKRIRWIPSALLRELGCSVHY